MLIRLFQSIRKQPKEVRDQYAFWIAVTMTGLIAVPWFLGLPEYLSSNETDVESQPMFSSLFNEASGRLSNVTESFDELRNQADPDASSTATPATTTIDMGIATSSSSVTPTAQDTVTTPRAVRIATTTASTSR